VNQVLIPGTEDNCPCLVYSLAISSFVCGCLALFLFFYDLIWSCIYFSTASKYVNIKQNVDFTPQTFVDQKIEIGEI